MSISRNRMRGYCFERDPLTRGLGCDCADCRRREQRECERAEHAKRATREERKRKRLRRVLARLVAADPDIVREVVLPDLRDIARRVALLEARRQ